MKTTLLLVIIFHVFCFKVSTQENLVSKYNHNIEFSSFSFTLFKDQSIGLPFDNSKSIEIGLEKQILNPCLSGKFTFRSLKWSDFRSDRNSYEYLDLMYFIHYTYGLNLLYRKVFRKRSSISMSIGGMYRTGRETYFLFNYWIETKMFRHYLSDFGGSIGLIYNFNLSKRIYLTTSLNYSKIIKHKDLDLSFEITDYNGSTQNLISYGLGAGFRF